VDFILARILFSLNITTILSAYIWELTLSWRLSFLRINMEGGL
jgi:hypothetical protein